MSTSSKGINIAIVGATGMVGEAICELLQKRKFAINSLHLLASERTAGTRVKFNGDSIVVNLLHEFDFSQVQIAIFAANDQVSADYAPKAVEAGCVVLDNSQHFVDDEGDDDKENNREVPLVVAGVNTDVLHDVDPRGAIIASPGSTAVQLLTVLKPVYDSARFRQVTVTTYQSASGQGKSAINELAMQTVNILNGRGIEKNERPRQIAFNIIPAVGELDTEGLTKGHSSAELQLVEQSKRLLSDSQLPLSVTCVRAPVFHADCMSIHIETCDPIAVEDVIALLKHNNSIKVLDGIENDDYVTPVTASTNGDKIFVSRIRNDLHGDCGLTMWVVADNIRTGVALNSVQIAEDLIKNYL